MEDHGMSFAEELPSEARAFLNLYSDGMADAERNALIEAIDNPVALGPDDPGSLVYFFEIKHNIRRMVSKLSREERSLFRELVLALPTWHTDQDAAPFCSSFLGVQTPRKRAPLIKRTPTTFDRLDESTQKRVVEVLKALEEELASFENRPDAIHARGWLRSITPAMPKGREARQQEVRDETLAMLRRILISELRFIGAPASR